MRWAVAWLLQIVSAPQGRWGCLLQVPGLYRSMYRSLSIKRQSIEQWLMQA